MDAKQLSKRLATVAKYVPEHARMADIGSDHAYLPAFLALQGKISFAVAGEVVKGPYENAVHEIKSQNLDHVITARLADGLDAVNLDDQIDTLTIAGMGGTLITKILEHGLAKLSTVTRLILQPNVGEYGLRKWLMEHDYEIIAEEILAEDGHTYEVIVAQPATDPIMYTEAQLLFGPYLVQQQGDVFQAKWQEQLTHLKQSIQHMEAAKNPPLDKIKTFRSEVKTIQEVLA